MLAASLKSPARLGVVAAIGVASFVTLFTMSIVLLGQTGHLDFQAGVGTLVGCGIGAFALAWLSGFGFWSCYFVGEKREYFVTIATWASVLLPIAAIVISLLVFPVSYWWFALPAQFIVGGVLGIAAAITRSRLWWLRGLWGMVVAAWGAMWAVTVTFWAK